jgi:hypothetical protein
MIEENIGGIAAAEAATEESATSDIYPDLTPEAPQAEKPESATGEAPETPEHPGPEPEEPEHIKELKKVRADRRQAREEAAYWKGVAEARVRPAEAPQEASQEQKPLVSPNPEDYDSQEAYIDALVDYRFEAKQHAVVDAATREAAQKRSTEIYGAYRQRMEEAAKDDPELREIEARTDLPISPSMAQIIHQSDIPDRLTRYFADHADEAQRLFGLAAPVVDARGNVIGINGNPLIVAREIGRIEAQLKAEPAPKKRTVSAAPEPHEPVGGRQGVVEAADAFDPALSTEERIAVWKAKGK